MTNSDVTKKLDEQKKTFAAGEFWNHAPDVKNDPKSVRTVACSHHGTCKYDGTCGGNSFGGGIQCYGFAKYMASLAFGTYPNVTASPSTAKTAIIFFSK